MGALSWIPGTRHRYIGRDRTSFRRAKSISLEETENWPNLSVEGIMKGKRQLRWECDFKRSLSPGWQRVSRCEGLGGEQRHGCT